MKPGQRLQGIWWAFMTETALVGAACWWRLRLHRAPAMMGPWLEIAILAVTVVDLGLAVWCFQRNWRPLCEASLKRVWAGRLVNAQEGGEVTQKLSSSGLVIMGLTVSPALYGLILAIVNASSPTVIGFLVGASVVGLLLFYREGVQPAHDIFRHVARIARG